MLEEDCRSVARMYVNGSQTSWTSFCSEHGREIDVGKGCVAVSVQERSNGQTNGSRHFDQWETLYVHWGTPR